MPEYQIVETFNGGQYNSSEIPVRNTDGSPLIFHDDVRPKQMAANWNKSVPSGTEYKVKAVA